MTVEIRARSSNTRRASILNAALDLFLERGVSGTTVDEIIERSEASVGSFYHHFESKLDVAASLYMATLDSYYRGFLSELRKHPRASEGIQAGVRYHLRWVRRTVKPATYLAHCREPEAIRASEVRTKELHTAFFQQIHDWLRTHAKKRIVRRLSFDQYFALWLGPADVFTRYWVLGPHDAKQLTRAEAVLPPAAWQVLRNS